MYVPMCIVSIYGCAEAVHIRASSRFSSTSRVQTASRLLIISLVCGLLLSFFFLLEVFFFFFYYSVYSCVVSLCVLYVFYKKKEESFLTVNQVQVCSCYWVFFLFIQIAKVAIFTLQPCWYYKRSSSSLTFTTIGKKTKNRMWKSNRICVDLIFKLNAGRAIYKDDCHTRD